MNRPNHMTRRHALQLLAMAGVSGAVALPAAAAAAEIGAFLPGKGWLRQGDSCPGDGTPLQFIPKTAPDPKPLENELQKYGKCPYCGMDRSQWHHSRHLIHYEDDLADGTCSIHCLAISLTLNLDRGIKAIYAADFAADGRPKPLVNIDQATYLIGSKLPGTMSAKSKMAFASGERARAAQAEQGGELGDFDAALREAYLGMAADTAMIRQRRAEKVKN